MNDMFIKTVKTVKCDLDIILSNKSNIEKIGSFGELNVGTSANKGSIHASVGVCTNANLWALDRYHSDDVPGIYWNDQTFTLLDYLGCKFSRLVSKSNSIVSPICDTHNVPLWQNPMRWKYVEFLIKELDYILDNGALMDANEL